LRVGVDQQRQQHLRRERRLPGVAELVACFELGEVHHPDRFHDQMDDVVFRQPFHHVGWQQRLLASLGFAEVVGNRSVRVGG
jgi:hypothetical protein